MHDSTALNWFKSHFLNLIYGSFCFLSIWCLSGANALCIPCVLAQHWIDQVAQEQCCTSCSFQRIHRCYSEWMWPTKMSRQFLQHSMQRKRKWQMLTAELCKMWMEVRKARPNNTAVNLCRQSYTGLRQRTQHVSIANNVNMSERLPLCQGPATVFVTKWKNAVISLALLKHESSNKQSHQYDWSCEPEEKGKPCGSCKISMVAERLQHQTSL